MTVRTCQRCGKDFEAVFEQANQPRLVCKDCHDRRHNRGKYRKRRGEMEVFFDEGWAPGARLRLEGEC